jgi:hypothetical protein
VNSPLFLAKFIEEGSEEAGDGIGCAMAELLEEAVEVERKSGLWVRRRWWGLEDGRCGTG